MSALFLFGAGASYGSGDCAPRCPPLGNELFAELQKAGGVAASIKPPLLDIFIREGFEQGMSALRQQNDVLTVPFLREIAEYFVQFEPGPKNLYRDLVAAIRAGRRPATIATTNYDMLIEYSINQAGEAMTYSGHPIGPNRISVLKIHGSCNFLPDLTGFRLHNVTFAHFPSIFEGAVRIAESPEEILRFCRTEDSVSPVIAIYAPGKQVLICPRFVAEQQKEFKRAALKAATIYIIGLRVIPDDDHIWGALASTDARIEYIGLEPEEFLAWADQVSLGNIHILERTFEKALPLIAIQLRQ